MARFTVGNVADYFEGRDSVLDEIITEGSDDELEMDIMDDESEGIIKQQSKSL